jgi:branched-chain amino acid transport system permease protein
VVALRFGQLAHGSVLVQAVLSGLLVGGVYSLVSMGLTLIFGVLGIINFAHGALMAVGMYCSYILVSGLGVPIYLTLPISMVVLFVVGAAIQKVVVNRAMDQPLENQLLVTLGLSILLENGLLLGFSATPRTVSTPFSGQALHVLSGTIELPRLVAFVSALLLAAGIYVLLHRTRLGMAVRAVSNNPRGASLVGVDVSRIYVLTFGLGAGCVGAAATLVLPFLPAQPSVGETFNLLAFVVVVLGGLGSVGGAVIGGILIGLTQEIGTVLFPGQSDLLAVFIVFVVVLFLRPQGLLGQSQ